MRILVVRLSSMGDVLHAMPAVAALRGAFPSAHIGWIIERRWRPLLAADVSPLSGPRSPQRPLVDQVHLVDTMGWRKSPFSKETRHEVRSAIQELRNACYDCALDFQGNIKSAVLATLSAAPQRLGFSSPREKPAALFYTHTVQSQGEHVVSQNLDLVRALSRRAPAIAFVQLPRDQSAEQACEAELARLGIHEFALLSPGAGWRAKQWPPRCFGEVARALGERGLQSLVNIGPGEDAIAREVIEHSHGSAFVLSATLPELVAYTRRARLFIGGDSGPMHLAAALRIPVVALFGPTDPRRNGPFGAEHVVLRSGLSMTSYSHKQQADAGLISIGTAEVISAANSLLARRSGR